MKNYPILIIYVVIQFFSQTVSGQNLTQAKSADAISKKLKFDVFTLDQKKSEQIRLSNSNKIIILDFWATWCLPCLENLKHLDSIADKYKEEVDVIAVSTEDINKIKKNLNYIPQLKSSNILFSSDTIHKSYIDYSTIPTTFIIKNGIIKYTSVGQYTTISNFDSLYKLSHGFEKKIKKTQAIKISEKVNNKIYKYSNYNIQFGKSQGGSPNFSFDSSKNGQYTFILENYSPLLLYRYTYDFISINWIINQLKNVDISYKADNLFSLRIEGQFQDKNQLLKVAQSVLAQNFPNIKTKMIHKMDSVFVLKIDTASLNFQKIISNDTVASSLSFYGPNFKGKNITTESLYDYISNEVGYLYNNVVVNGTKFKKRINLNLEWSYAKPSTLATELSKYGISLTKELKEVEFLVLY